MERALNAASRQIDGACGRRFWQDPTAVARTYDAESAVYVEVDDISTTTGLIVKVDYALDGSFGVTLTINTHFMVLPYNAALAVPAWPYTAIRLVGQAIQYFPDGSTYGRPSVQVTAKFGWPAVPDDVKQACLVQAGMLYKSPDAPFGAIALGDTGASMRIRAGLHPTAYALLSDYMKPAIA